MALVATKPATGITTDVALVVAEDPERVEYASRGGHKLAGALEAFAAHGAHRDRQDDASTRARRRAGSPTYCSSAGAREVVAVDVGYGQLAWRLQSDERVVVHDRTNIRDLTLDLVGEPVDLVVGDLSFISLVLVLDALSGVTADRRGAGADGQAPVRGRQGPRRQGWRGARPVPARRGGARGRGAAEQRGWGAVAVATSPLPGPSGNVEFFLLLRRGPAGIGIAEITAEVERSAGLGVPGEKVDP